MKAAIFALPLSLALLAGPAGAVESCAAAQGTPNNPAFGAPRPCGPTAKPVTAAGPIKGKTPDKVTTQDDKTVYRYGDTTVAVGGYVSYDLITGKGTPRK